MPSSIQQDLFDSLDPGTSQDVSGPEKNRQGCRDVCPDGTVADEADRVYECVRFYAQPVQRLLVWLYLLLRGVFQPGCRKARHVGAIGSM